MRTNSLIGGRGRYYAVEATGPNFDQNLDLPIPMIPTDPLIEEGGTGCSLVCEPATMPSENYHNVTIY